MATKIVIRTGTKIQIPILDVGEIGYVTDIRAGVIGDGSSNPPLLMSTKSTGDYDFSATNIVKFNKLIANTLNGIDFGALNASNGILVRTGDGAFSSRKLTSGNGSVKFTFPDGVLDNPDIRISPDLDLSSGTQGIILPRGTTDLAQRGPNVVGKLRYAINPGTPYKNVEIFSVDNAWRVLKEFVWQNDYALTVGTDYSSIQDCISRHLLVDCTGQSIINYPEGNFNIGNGIFFNYSGAKKSWSINGVQPLIKNINSIVSVTGTNNNWSVKFALDSVSNINVGNYVLVDSLKGYTHSCMRGKVNITQNSPAIVSCLQSDYAIVNTNFNFDSRVGDTFYTSLDPIGNTYPATFASKIQSISSANSFTSTNNAMGSRTQGIVYSCFDTTGTWYCPSNGSYNLVGIGNIATQELNVGDWISLNTSFIYNRRITAINNDNSITLDRPINDIPGVNVCPSTAGTAIRIYVNNNPELHLGTWLITNVDTVNNTVTFLNTAYSLPPVNKMGSGLCKILKSVVTFTNPADGGFNQYNESVNYTNIVIVSSTKTGINGINIYGNSRASVSDISCIGFTAGAGINVQDSSVIFCFENNKSISVSNCKMGISISGGSSLLFACQTIVNCITQYGIICDNNSTAIFIGTNNNQINPYKLPLSITDTPYGLFIYRNSSVYTEACVISNSQTLAIQVGASSSYDSTYSTVILNSTNAIRCTNASTVFCAESKFLASLNAKTGVECSYTGDFFGIRSNVSGYTQNFSITNNSSCLFTYGYSGENQGNAIVMAASCTFDLHQSFIYYGNSIKSFYPNNIYSTDCCSIIGYFASIYSDTGFSSSVYSNGGSYANLYLTNLYTNTTLSPPANVTGNNNSFIVR